jgi:hypothetical protein
VKQKNSVTNWESNTTESNDEDDIVCLCRGLYMSDFASEEEMIERLRQKDGRCYQCTLRFDI